MGQRQTSVSERNYFIDLKLTGLTLEEVAEETGWSLYCVRYWWRRYRDGGRKALDPPDGRKQRGGSMSTFPGVMRFAFLRIKKEHPGWGADVDRVLRLFEQGAVLLLRATDRFFGKAAFGDVGQCADKAADGAVGVVQGHGLPDDPLLGAIRQQHAVLTAADRRVAACAPSHPGGSMENTHLRGRRPPDRRLYSLIAPRPCRIIMGRDAKRERAGHTSQGSEW